VIAERESGSISASRSSGCTIGDELLPTHRHLCEEGIAVELFAKFNGFKGLRNITPGGGSVEKPPRA